MSAPRVRFIWFGDRMKHRCASARCSAYARVIKLSEVLIDGRASKASEYVCVKCAVEAGFEPTEEQKQ